MIGNLTLQSILIALSGIVTVFLILAVLCLLIPAISKIVQFFTPKQAEKSQPPVQQPLPRCSNGSVTLIDVDEKTAACIMAIVSHETGIPLAELNFCQIRALEK